MAKTVFEMDNNKKPHNSKNFGILVKINSRSVLKDS
jgi:hypothetical protein